MPAYWLLDSNKFLPNTEYHVYVSAGIAGIDTSVTLNVSHFKFKTKPADALNELPENVVIEDLPTVLGRYIYDNSSDTPNPNILSMVSSVPSNLSVNNISTTILVTFDKAIITEDVSSLITITAEGIFDDSPSEFLTFSASIKNSTSIEIVLTQYPGDNKICNLRIANTVDPTLPFSVSFATLLTPYYSSIKALRLIAGTVLTSINDIGLSLMIYAASLEADMKLRGIKNVVSANDYIVIRNKYVLYSSLKTALLNNFNFGLADSIRKQVGDITIQISSSSKAQLYNKLLDEINDYEDDLTKTLAAKGGSSFIKSCMHPNYRRLGRQYVSPNIAINAKVPYYNRILHTYGG